MRLDKLIIMQTLSRMLAEPYTFAYTDLDGDHTATFTPRVYRGRKTVSGKDAVNAISILEAARTTPGSPAGVEGQARIEQWPLLLQGWPTEDRENPSDPAYIMAAAVRERLGRLIETRRDTGEPLPVYPDVYLFGKRVHEISFAPTTVVPFEENPSAVAAWYLPMTVTLVQKTGTH